jgi:hypothetical protein
LWLTAPALSTLSFEGLWENATASASFRVTEEPVARVVSAIGELCYQTSPWRTSMGSPLPSVWNGVSA